MASSIWELVRSALAGKAGPGQDHPHSTRTFLYGGGAILGGAILRCCYTVNMPVETRRLAKLQRGARVPTSASDIKA